QGMCICTPGFGDCDATADNGCEQSLDTVAHCGMCNTVGLGCDRPGVRQVCTPPTAPGVGSCEGCIEGHFDLDGSAATGCETGLVLQAQSDLSANLPGTILDVAVDGDAAYVLVDDGTLQIVPVDVSGAAAVPGTTVDTGATASGMSRLAVQNGVVGVTGVGNLINVYINNQTLELIDNAVWAGVADISIVPTPVTPNAVAELVAAGTAGTRWYGVYPMGMAPGGLPGGACSPVAAGHTLCLLGSDANPANAVAVQGVVLNGNPYAVVVGDTDTVEQEFFTTPGISPLLVNGDDFSATLVDTAARVDAIYSIDGA